MTRDALKWNFEAFRQFLSFEVLQQAAASIMPFDGFNYRNEVAMTRKFEGYIALRTGLEWAPKRDAPEGVFFDPEGSIFRNKARVFTSLGILDPVSLQSEQIVKLTKFGRQLGSGLVSRDDFYKFQIENFEYPHPAYPESGKSWDSEKASVKPFKFLIEILVRLAETSIDENRLSTREFLMVANDGCPTFDAKIAAKSIIDIRASKDVSPDRQFATEAKRNATDLLGFFCMTGVAYFNQNGEVCLNLIRQSKKDRTYFHFKSRDGENSLNEIRNEFGIGE